MVDKIETEKALSIGLSCEATVQSNLSAWPLSCSLGDQTAFFDGKQPQIDARVWEGRLDCEAVSRNAFRLTCRDHRFVDPAMRLQFHDTAQWPSKG